MKLIVFYFFALAWSLGQSRGIGVGTDPINDSLNDEIEQDAKIEELEEQNDAEATVEVEEAEEEVLEATPEDDIAKAKRLIPILMRLQKKYPTLGKDEQVKVLRQSSGYKEDFKEALDKLEGSPQISHDLDIPYLSQILGVVRLRKPKKETIPTPEGSPVETNIIPKEDENEYPIKSGLNDEEEESVEELSEEDLTRDIVVQGLFAVDFDPDSKIAKEGIFAVDVIDPDSEIVTVGLFANNVTDADNEDLEGFPFARAASFIPRPHQEPLPPTAPQPSLPHIPSEFANIPLDNFEDFSDYFDDFNEVEINLNFAAPFPSPKRKPAYPRRPFYPPQQKRTYLPPLTRSLPYSPQVARPYPILPVRPQFPPTHIYHRPMHSRKRRSTAPSHPYAPPHHYTHHPQYQYPRQLMYQMYHPYWDTSYQQAYHHQPLHYGDYNPYVFDYQTSASLDDPLLTAHYPSDYYGYSMQSLPSLRPSNPFSQMQSPGLALNPHYQYSRAAYQNFLHESMDGQDPVKYVQGLTGA